MCGICVLKPTARGILVLTPTASGIHVLVLTPTAYAIHVLVLTLTACGISVLTPTACGIHVFVLTPTARGILLTFTYTSRMWCTCYYIDGVLTTPIPSAYRKSVDNQANLTWGVPEPVTTESARSKGD